MPHPQCNILTGHSDVSNYLTMYLYMHEAESEFDTHFSLDMHIAKSGLRVYNSCTYTPHYV